MYDKTITLFNRLHSAAGDTWFPTVLKGVNLIIDKASIVAKYGETNESSASLHVKFDKDAEGNIIVADKPCLLPKAWNEVLHEQLPNYITFKSGNDGDFFIEGEHDWGVIDDNDYTDGFLNYAVRHYDHVFVITNVGRYDLIPHFEILGK